MIRTVTSSHILTQSYIFLCREGLKCNVTKMDVTALLVFVSGFVVCAGAVFLISIVGAKEETYEEAIEKQKKANEKERRSKDKKKDNENKKTKNWRMKKKGEKDDKHDGLVSS